MKESCDCYQSCFGDNGNNATLQQYNNTTSLNFASDTVNKVYTQEIFLR